MVHNVYHVNMTAKTATVGVRMAATTSRILKEVSAGQGRTPSDLLAEYAEEIVRKHQFCHIEFRSTAAGRMAYVEGTRTAVWLVVDILRQHKNNIKKTAKLHGWPETKLRAALNYAKAFPEEIEPLIEKAHSMTLEKLQRLTGG